MTSLVQANVTYVCRHQRPLRSSCFLIIVCQKLWEDGDACVEPPDPFRQAVRAEKMSGCPFPPLALFTASTYSFLVVIIVSMTTGDLSNILISTLILCVRAACVRVCVFLPMWSANVNFANYLDHIWGLMYSNVHTFTVLILPLKVLSYPKSNHHALFITYSTKAQHCVTSEKWHKTT